MGNPDYVPTVHDKLFTILAEKAPGLTYDEKHAIATEIETRFPILAIPTTPATEKKEGE